MKEIPSYPGTFGFMVGLSLWMTTITLLAWRFTASRDKMEGQNDIELDPLL